MLVTVDIGNTNITIGIFDKDDLIGTYRLTTKVRRTSDEYGFMLKNFLDRSNVHEKQIDAVIVSSVVPKVMHSFTNGIKKFVGIEPLIVGPGVKSGISVQLENPRNVGADRIADCAGAFNEYGGPILVADFGTATTYDYVDEMVVLKQEPLVLVLKQVPMPYGDKLHNFLKLRSNVLKLSWQEIHKQKCRLVYFINS